MPQALQFNLEVERIPFRFKRPDGQYIEAVLQAFDGVARSKYMKEVIKKRTLKKEGGKDDEIQVDSDGMIEATIHRHLFYAKLQDVESVVGEEKIITTKILQVSEENVPEEDIAMWPASVTDYLFREAMRISKLGRSDAKNP